MSHHEKPGPPEGMMMKNTEDDTEGHRWVPKADGSEDDDVEGHRMVKS